MLLIFLHDICLPVWRSPSLGRRVRWDYISFWLWLDSGHPKLSCILWWSFRSLWFSFVWDLEVFCSFRHQGSSQSCQYWHLKIFLYIFHISRIALHPFQGSRSPLRKYHLSKFLYLCKKKYIYPSDLTFIAAYGAAIATKVCRIRAPHTPKFGKTNI